MYPPQKSGEHRETLYIPRTVLRDHSLRHLPRTRQSNFRAATTNANRVCGNAGHTSFELNVAGVSVAPNVASQTFGPLPFNRGSNGFHAQFSAKDFAGRGVLEMEITATRNPQAPRRV